ncbi:MAG TPA: hypothetical protein VGR98_20015, partial [Streptosporangiaceae bacterium]|nr:hypothetical protein [Streptosporangiaceae bacterium]
MPGPFQHLLPLRLAQLGQQHTRERGVIGRSGAWLVSDHPGALGNQQLPEPQPHDPAPGVSGDDLHSRCRPGDLHHLNDLA